MTAALELVRVSYSVNGSALVRDVSWAIEPGQRWAVLGPNGAGKTTLLKLLCGYIWPDAGGVVRRKGEVLSDLRALRRSIGWATSTLTASIPARETALEVTLSGLYAQTRYCPVAWEQPNDADVQHARHCLADLACSHLADRTFGTLSQGEQQKVLIARALMAKPFMIILDEPCAGLDPGARERLLATLQSLANANTELAMIYVTHHIEEILPAFTHTLVLNAGQVRHCGDTHQALSPTLLAELYGVPIDVVERGGRYWPMWGQP